MSTRNYNKCGPSSTEPPLNFFLVCSIFANNLCSRPVTIWSLAGHNTGTNKDSSAKIASQLFRAVATSVWEHGENAILSRHCVNDQQKKCKTNGSVWNIMVEILRLLNDSTTIDIIGNEQLNRPLTNLANEISPSLITANTEVTRTIFQIFIMCINNFSQGAAN
ncbi:MAG: hypothetical protein EXX96DRAFT_492306 [Benjaminiella poitrasii]|nr:MAG: hypothetical protein EXX96DRAFT_492306 [Benjaminiella poitrasii]